ncbi:hypothetical protein BH20ACT9_BH20ACT9_21690 [soil metagenome]
MLPALADLLVLAQEEPTGYAPGDPLAKLAVPLGVIILLGSVYVLLRANLGTRRGYLVLGTSLFGFITILSLFWAFGAPGTPPATGPTSLPGQPADAYVPTWYPFAGDSLLANEPEYQFAKSYPEGFGEVPPDLPGADVETGITTIQTFFTSEDFDVLAFPETWVVDEQSIRYRMAESGYPVIGVTFQETDERLNVVPGGEEFTAFAYFDAGNPPFPSFVVFGFAVVLFVVHALLLDRDEQRERRRAAEETGETERRPVGAAR